LTAEDVDLALNEAASMNRGFIALAAPEVPLEIRHYFLKRATECSAFRAAAFTTAEIPPALEIGMMRFVDLVAMNEDEAQALIGVELNLRDPFRFLKACERVISAFSDDLLVVVTAGKSGAMAIHRGAWDFCPAPEVPVASTAGAGDALLAGILAGLAMGLPFMAPGNPRSLITERPLSSAFDLGVLLAAFSVTSPHTIHPDAGISSLRAFADQLGITLGRELLRVLHVS
jgi:sugar/nucleoside kinase (ribokinase family)